MESEEGTRKVDEVQLGKEVEEEELQDEEDDREEEEGVDGTSLLLS